ncbi:hypothetical protein CCAX7_37130 [Capsulimonas corticalis]|uniref:Uncharacterized protein n=1 Tax=Capsulimonas corticalis TaxID=2219043 RepID=A0A402D1A6_9BACT|nr:hypothetical protein [Capsulimonas corticalis]BDI31662.1 hypothetical protein CCAX7_37130 [Capsulimonas corticalis]
MTNHYLIFEKSAHAVIHIIQGGTLTEALWNYIVRDQTEATLQEDGSVFAWGTLYPHPLSYIERWHKIEGDWQIRDLPDWAWSDPSAQVFADKGPYNTALATESCLAKFRKRFPKADAQFFVWPLKTGVLVTFYQQKHLELKIMKRYLWVWDGKREKISEWKGDEAQLAEELDTQTVRLSLGAAAPLSSMSYGGVGF